MRSKEKLSEEEGLALEIKTQGFIRKYNFDGVIDKDCAPQKYAESDEHFLVFMSNYQRQRFIQSMKVSNH